MKIAHVALWTRNWMRRSLSGRKCSAGRATNAISVKLSRLRLTLHFLSEGPTIELMALPELDDAPANPEFVGWAHIAITVGGSNEVDAMAQKHRQTGVC